MRILLDESLPRKLKGELKGHEVATVPEMGWAGKKNGELIRLATGRFDVFVTIDQNLIFQQNWRNMSIGLVMLVAPDNRFETPKPLMPRVIRAVEILGPGEVVQIVGEDDQSVLCTWYRMHEFELISRVGQRLVRV